MSAVAVSQHFRILGALMKREMTTRFGRRGLGFAWLIAEPLAFCFGVMILWSFRGKHMADGVNLGPFVMTGYMSLIVIRHMIGLVSGAVASNTGLLYHRIIRPMHLIIGRICLEFLGTTTAYIIVYAVLLFRGDVHLPTDYPLLYAGWMLLTWNAVGLALMLSGLAMRFDFIERLINMISYAMIPLSGAFWMVAWLPYAAREYAMLIPFVHGIEMMRASVFGEFVETHYNPAYALTVGAVMIILGLLIISTSRDRLEAE